MKRRDFLTKSSVGVAAALAAGTASAQGLPAVKWRMASSYPKSLDTVFGSSDELCKRVGELTEGKFEIRVFAAGEIVPALQVMDAVSSGSAECCHTISTYFIGKNPALAFDSGVAFGLNARQQNAWLYQGGGLQVVREVFAQYGCTTFPVGNVGVQMGGWFRKEIKTLADLKGLKMRIGGLGGMVMSKLGAVPQQIAAGEMYAALERGTIDAAEWIGPYDDEKFGFHRVAKYYYTPGWWEGSAQISSIVNLKAWDALPKLYQAAWEVACTEQNVKMLANYDSKNPDALKRLLAGGVQLKNFPPVVMDAAYKAAFELFDELSEKNADFKKVYASWRKFREDQVAWFRVADYNLDNYTSAMMQKRK